MKEVTAILEEASKLTELLKHSAIYEEFKRAYMDLERYPELKAMSDEFRKENYLAYTSLEEDISFADVDILEEKRFHLAKYPQIDRYLKAELALCRIMQEVQDQIFSVISFE